MVKVAFFASGNGSNAQNIYDYFNGNPQLGFTRIFCNNPSAFVLRRAENMNLPSMVFDRKTFNESNEVLSCLLEDKTDWIILAGFLWKIPENILKAFPDRIINIHPALLPKFGGKGMYGMNVHQAVKHAGETKSGITIHLVNEHYDDGKILFQAECMIHETDTAEDIANKVHKLEYEYFPKVIENCLLSK